MSKFNVVSKYVAAVPRSQRRKGAGVFSAPSSGVAGSGIDKNALSQFVDLYSPQTVEGLKNFLNGLQVGGKLVKYDAATNAFVFPANAVFEGGVAWNTKLEGFEKQTVTAAVQVDWDTIGKNENGELYVIGGTSGGGGGVVGGVTIDEVKNYLTAEKYTTETWVSAQNYATQSWVTNKGYITGITSSMVTSALGYTPLDSANFTKAKIKSTLGISDWALASVKPSYKFAEITEKPTTLAEYGITDAYTKAQVNSALAKKWTQDDSLIANWNTAFGWGNHAAAGYAKHSDVTEEFKKYVTLSTAQTITGIKNFSNGFKVGNVLVSYNASKNAFILPANVIVEGGIAWNSSLDGFDVPTIAQAVKVDGSTIGKMADGTLYVIDGTGGGIDEEQLANYLTNNNYAKKSDIPSLSGYATKSFVTSQGYITSAAIPTKLSQLEDDVVNVSIVKNFLNGLKVGGALVTYNAQKNAFVFPANAIFEGGIAWNSKIDGFSIPTIMDAVIVDEDTIIKENGVLKVNGDVSGGINESQLGDYLTRNNYAKKSDIPSLSGYATEAFVTTRGYITSSAIPTKVSAFTNDSGYITGITSSMVTSALGYTPFSNAGGTINGALTVASTVAASSAIRATEVLRVNTVDSAGSYAYIRAQVGSASITNRAVAHLGTNYGYGYNFTLTNAYDAIAMYRSVVGVGGTFTYDELYANQAAGIALAVRGSASITGNLSVAGSGSMASLSIGGSSLITYDASLKAFVFNGNLIVKGGIAWEKQNS
jgi:hypothetical protein